MTVTKQDLTDYGKLAMAYADATRAHGKATAARITSVENDETIQILSQRVDTAGRDLVNKYIALLDKAPEGIESTPADEGAERPKIRIPEELEILPVGSVVLGKHGAYYRQSEIWWQHNGMTISVWRVELPATVIYNPEDPR